MFVEVDHSLLERNIFGLVGFAKLLENLSVKQENNISENTEDMLILFFFSCFSLYVNVSRGLGQASAVKEILRLNRNIQFQNPSASPFHTKNTEFWEYARILCHIFIALP